MMKRKKQKILTVTLFVLYILLLIGIILFKLPFYSKELGGIRIVNLIPFRESFDENGVFFLGEVIGNVLVFIPLGVYICMLKSKWPFVKKILPVIGLTLAFEIIQFIFAIGRTDITDILDNTIGGIIGVGIYALLFKIFKGRTVNIANIIALILTVCVVSKFSYLFYLSHFVMRH